MAGITTSAFRKICLDHNAGAVYAEMISDKGIYYQNEKTLKMVSFDPSEHPLALQLFGNDSSSITFAAKKILELCTPDMLDVNMGCPVQKVVKNGSGSALMKTPEKIYEIVSDLKENVNIPITIKIRAGWDHSSINCDEVAKLACRAGVDAIAIHGRTRSQMYNGTCNLDYIKMVKEVSTVPVIGSGDVKDIKSAEKMFNETGVDAIMIGRGVLGNPWLIKEIDTYLKNRQNINLIILLIDIRHKPGANDKTMLEYIKSTGRRYIVIASKSDKIAKTKVPNYVENLAKELDVPSDLIFSFSSMEYSSFNVHKITCFTIVLYSFLLY